MRRILTGLVLILMLVSAAVAEPFDEATRAHHRGDYATAFRLFRPLAEQGIAAAQYNLGLMYDKGHGVTQDYVQAHKRKPAEAGLVHT
jgi:TPR repeat protein